eukprot:804815-Pelagomonas_calceolata.AAC.2
MSMLPSKTASLLQFWRKALSKSQITVLLFGTSLLAKFLTFSLTTRLVCPQYPDTNLPTLLVYYGGACKKHLVGPGAFGGPRISPELSHHIQVHSPVFSLFDCSKKPPNGELLMACPNSKQDKDDVLRYELKTYNGH